MFQRADGTGSRPAADGGSAVRPLRPVVIERGRIGYAPGVRAGRWVFATGLLATDFANGLDPEVRRAALSLSGLPKAQRESAHVFARLREILREAGTDLSQVVRLDQYYPAARSVDAYHTVRRATFGDVIPASTSILVPDLLLPDAEIDLQAIAVVPDAASRATVIRPEDAYVPPESGHSPVVRSGDFLFVAGQLARGADGAIAAEAKVSADQLWKGTPIKRETEYLIRRKIEPALAAAGSSPANIVKAQVYLSDISDLPAFREVWCASFPGDRRHAVTYVPTAVPGFGTLGANVEINIVALADQGETRKRIVDAEVFTGLDGDCAAVRAGDLLFLSGLMAVDRSGPAPRTQPDPRQPYFGSAITEQMRRILSAAARLCRAAGTSLANVVRVQQFHTDLNEFQGAYEAWRERLGDRPLPFSAVGVPAPLPVPGCTVLVDLWIYCPPEAPAERGADGSQP